MSCLYCLFVYVEMNMKIKKILNNNVVIVSESESGKEKIIMSNGLGFKKKVGDTIIESSDQQIFVLSDELYQKYERLTEVSDPRAAEIAEKIISYASEHHKLELGEIIHLTLTDHINGVLKRLNKNLSLSNKMTLEISRIYNLEFQIGCYACQILEETTGMSVPNDEAAFVAMHLINNQVESDISENKVKTTIAFVTDIVKVVESYFHCQYDQYSFSYYRFVTHLKGLINRIYSDKPFQDDENLFDIMRKSYPEPARAAEKVVQMILLKYGKDVSTEEKSYLTLYIEKLNRER